MITPNSLLIVSNTTPIYVGESFNILVGYVGADGSLTPLTPAQFIYRILNNNQSQITDNTQNQETTLINTEANNNSALSIISGVALSIGLTSPPPLVFTANYAGSYGIYIEYGDVSQIFYFVAVKNIQRIGYSQLYTILKQELPSSYCNDINTSSGNYLDNYASCMVLQDMYTTLYNIVYQQYPSNGYNANWEYALNGTNNVLTNAVYPAQVTNLLWQIPYQTGITWYDLTLFLAKLCYYWTGQSAVVTIDNDTNIIIYSINGLSAWVLGDSVSGLLGETTYLSNLNDDLFVNVVVTLILRLFPVQVKFTLSFSTNNPLDTLTSIGYSYLGDLRPRLGLAYLGDSFSPFNIEAYI